MKKRYNASRGFSKYHPTKHLLEITSTQTTLVFMNVNAQVALKDHSLLAMFIQYIIEIPAYPYLLLHHSP
jgi:hypothetical protein